MLPPSTTAALRGLVELPLGWAQEAAAATPKTPATSLVTYDLVGTFPANAPTRLLMAPGPSFLLEITFPQTVPAITFDTFALGAVAVSGTYSFQGHTDPVTRGTYEVSSNNLNYSAITVTTPAGTLYFHTGGSGSNPNPANPVGLPISVYRPVPTPDNPDPDGTATFLTGDVGNPGSWPCTFTNRFGQSFPSSAAVLDVVGRLVLPPHPLATR